MNFKHIILSGMAVVPLGITGCSGNAGLFAAGAVGLTAYSVLSNDEEEVKEPETYAEMIQMCPPATMQQRQATMNRVSQLAVGMPKTYVHHVAGMPERTELARLSTGEVYQVWLYRIGGVETCPYLPQQTYTPVILSESGHYVTQGGEFLDARINPFISRPIDLFEG